MPKSSLLPLTIIILTHRHDKRFIQALASAQPAKEILVFDFESQNNWASLAVQFHFKKITRRGPIKNFSVERNNALKKASNDWVFFLDSDEEIDASSWIEISKLLQSDLDGVFVRRRDIFYGKTMHFGETGSIRLLRLMRKRASQFVRPVHEIAQIEGKLHLSKITILHFAHQNINEFFQAIAGYAQIEAEHRQESRLPVWLLGLKTIIYPLAKFCQNYFFKLGLLDGWRGLVYASLMSLHSLSVRVFSYENR